MTSRAAAVVVIATMSVGCGRLGYESASDGGKGADTGSRDASDDAGVNDGGRVDGGGADGGGVDGGGVDGGMPIGAVWRPAPRTSWQCQLSGALDTSFDVAMYSIDLFDTPEAQIAGLQADGRIVICYFSAGSHENFRDDADDFPPSAIGDVLEGWPDERWLDVRDATVRTIMQARLDVAVAKGCDGVEPDNVDGYTTYTGFLLTAADQLDYNRFLAREAHARSLSVGLKNDIGQVAELVPDFDWALNEECHRYHECDALAPFISAGKAVFHVEYGSMALASTVCPATMPLGFSTLIKRLDLNAWRVACP